MSWPEFEGHFNQIVKNMDQAIGKARNGLHLKELNMVKISKGCFAKVQVKRYFLPLPEGLQPRFWLSSWHFRRQVEK